MNAQRLSLLRKPVAVAASLCVAALLWPAAGRAQSTTDTIRFDPDMHLVAIEALVVEVQEDRARDIGLTYGFSETTIGEDGLRQGGDGNFVGGQVDLGAGPKPVSVPIFFTAPEGRTAVDTTDALPGLGISLVGMDIDTWLFSAQLRALLDAGEAVVRTRPIAVALNRTKVRIEATNEVPVQTLKSNQLHVEFEKVGVKMDVTPTIRRLAPGVVNLNIANIEVSSVASFATTQDIDRPVFNKSNTNTRITLNEGETFVIGGLKTRYQLEKHDQVPILSWIPVLGELFKSHSYVDRNMDVLFFVTPYILRPGQNFLVPFDFENQEPLGLETNVERADR